MKVVMVSGWKNSGKDMVADFLVRNKGFSKLSFAGLLKDMASEQYGVPRGDFEDRLAKESPILHMPARAEDAWSLGIMNMVFGHLRTAEGKRASRIALIEKETANVYGVTDSHVNTVQQIDKIELLYHTPRSIAVIEGSTKRSVASDYWVRAAIKSTTQDGLYVISDLRFKSEIRQLKEAAGADNVVSLRINRFDDTPETDPSERDLDDHSFDFYINNREEDQITRNQVFEQVIEALVDSKVIAPAPLI